MTTEYRTVNPVNNELVREFPTLDDVEAENVLQRAHSAFLDWRDADVPERVHLYRQAGGTPRQERR